MPKTLDARKDEFIADYKKYLKGEYKSEYELADKYKVSYTTIYRYAKSLGLPHKHGVGNVDVDKFIECYNKYASCKITKMQLAAELGIAYPTLQKWLYELFDNNLKVEGLSFVYDERDWKWKEKK